MPTYKIRGIDVDFPYEAYDTQLAYMNKVIQALQQKCNALLESPTGTGKTISLLCATLAWRKSLGNFTVGVNMKVIDNDKPKDDSEASPSQYDASGSSFPTILYASRTHSQIRQVIQELKRTSYRPKMVVLGSREQLCIHDEVKLLHGTMQTNACKLRRGKDQCDHSLRVPDYLESNPHLGEEPVDIEDLVNIGRRFGPCPYYLSKELHTVVDIVFAPYNYLIDRGTRNSLHLTWSNSILIFDEAHNLESICADAASFDLPSWLLTACITEAQTCIDLSTERREKSIDKSQNPDDFAILRELLLKLENRIAEVPIESNKLGYTKHGHYIYELLADLNITNKTASKLSNIIAEASTLLEEHNQQKLTGSICRLDSLSEILDIIFRGGRTDHAQYYRVHVQEVEATNANGYKGKTSRTLSWWCFNPGIIMEEFPKLGVRSVILTSGTLYPLDSFAQELKLDFPVQLENPHVITPNQIWAGVVPVGPSGCTFNSTYDSRDSQEYRKELGNAIVNLVQIVPDGLLVFFTSYYLLDQCIGCWKCLSNENSASIWERICKHKKPVIEPRESLLFASSIKDYMSKLNDSSASGAVFFAVCRGKVSEGLDFADHAGRAVVMIGLPHIPFTDPKVCLKRDYLNEHSRAQGKQGKRLKVLTGYKWYNQQASRAVNQAVGRVIRHRHDYGAIIFLDERFTRRHQQSQVSRWIQPHIKCFSRFGEEVVLSLTHFFWDEVTRGGSLKLSLLEAEDQGNVGEITSTEHLRDKFNVEKFLSPPTRPVAQNISSKASPLLDTRKGCTSSLGEIVPVNRSSLDSDNCKIVGCESSRDKCGTFLHGKKTVLSQEYDMVDLTDNRQLGEKSMDALITPCSTKKRRIITGEYNLQQQLRNPHEHSSGSGELQHENDGTSQHRNQEFISQKGDLPADSAASASNRTQRLAFIGQVQEKLNKAEFKDFVGYLNAHTTKAMKIDEVLQSISKLFSGPERLHLLKGFKDYVPAKHLSLYKQYVKEMN